MTSEPPQGSGPDPIERGEKLASRIPRLVLPQRRAEEIQRAMAQRLAGRTVPSRARRPAWVGIAAALLAAVVLVAVTWLVLPSSRLRVETGPVGVFGKFAVDVHQELRGPSPSLDLVTGSPTEVREWLRRLGLSAALSETRPVDEASQFQVLGTTRVVATFPVAAVSYRIDARPVTLLVSPQAHAPEVPPWSLLGKTVRVSTDPATRAQVLTWRSSGKAYSLVSELPTGDPRACFICHTEPTRREVIEELASQL